MVKAKDKRPLENDQQAASAPILTKAYERAKEQR
jgi:hypothetical protein